MNYYDYGIYYKLPIELFQDKYNRVTNDAKLAYSLLINKLEECGEVDENGLYYVRYFPEDLKNELNCSNKKIVRIKDNLIENDLLEQVKDSSSKNYKYYISNP